MHLQPAVAKQSPRPEVDIAAGLVCKHVAADAQLPVTCNRLPEAHQLPVVAAVEILATLDIQGKGLIRVVEDKGIEEAEIIEKGVAVHAAT